MPELCKMRIGSAFVAYCLWKDVFFLGADLSLSFFFFLFVQVALVLSCIKYQAKFVHIVSGGTQFLM